YFFFSSRRRHTRFSRDWSSDVCSSDLIPLKEVLTEKEYEHSKFEILQALTQLSGFIPGLDNYINSAAKREIIVYNKKFASFLMRSEERRVGKEGRCEVSQ